MSEKTNQGKRAARDTGIDERGRNNINTDVNYTGVGCVLDGDVNALSGDGGDIRGDQSDFVGDGSDIGGDESDIVEDDSDIGEDESDIGEGGSDSGDDGSDNGRNGYPGDFGDWHPFMNKVHAQLTMLYHGSHRRNCDHVTFRTFMTILKVFLLSNLKGRCHQKLF